MTARIGTGTTITFVTSGFTAEIVGISIDGIKRESIDVTHLATPVAGAGEVGSREKIPSKHVDPGQLKLTCHYDPDTDPPIQGAKETVTVTYPLEAGQLTPASEQGDAFIVDVGVEVPLEDKMMRSITIERSGPWTRTASTS